MSFKAAMLSEVTVLKALPLLFYNPSLLIAVTTYSRLIWYGSVSKCSIDDNLDAIFGDSAPEATAYFGLRYCAKLEDEMTLVSVASFYRMSTPRSFLSTELSGSALMGVTRFC